jgi:hypothetical protein
MNGERVALAYKYRAATYQMLGKEDLFEADIAEADKLK